MRNASFDTVPRITTPSIVHVIEQDDIVKSFNDLACTLRGLSGHQNVWYGYQKDQQLIFKHDLSLFTHSCTVDVFHLANFTPDKHYILKDTSLGDIFKHIYMENDLHPCSASILYTTLPDLESPLYFILFSDHHYYMESEVWENLNEYFDKYVSNLHLKIENQQLKSRLEELEEINSGRAKYFAVIAHDLRAPFHGILGCADILLNESQTLDRAAANRLTEYLYDTTQSTYGLLENLLNWAMSEGGRFHQKKIHFRVADVVQNVFDLLCAFAYKKQIKLQCDVAPNLYGYADVRMVTSILQNLTSNALKFTAPNANKKVKIQAVFRDYLIQVSVQDEGVGMTPLQLEKLFQEHTIPSTQGTSGEKGTGLGVVLCKRFLEMNGGEIYASSTLNEGTCFTVTLPMGKEAH